MDTEPPRPDQPHPAEVPSPPAAPAEDGSGRSSRPWWLIVVGGLLAGVVVVAGIGALLDGPRSAADEAFGLPRVQSEEIDALEDALGSIQIGDLEMDIAAYGEDDEIQVMVFTYGNLPETFSVDSMVRGGAGGIIGSGGSADIEAISSHEIDGVEYVCVPFQGQLMPSSAPGDRGVACGWAAGEGSAVMLMDTTTTDAGVAATHAAELHVSQE